MTELVHKVGDKVKWLDHAATVEEVKFTRNGVEHTIRCPWEEDPKGKAYLVTGVPLSHLKRLDA